MSIGGRFMLLVALSLALAIGSVGLVIVDRERRAAMLAAEAQGYALADALSVTFLAYYLRSEDDLVREIGTQVVEGDAVGGVAAPLYLVVVGSDGRVLFSRGNERVRGEDDAVLTGNAVATDQLHLTDCIRLRDGTAALDLKARMVIHQAGGGIRRFGAVRLGLSLVALEHEIARTFRTVALLALAALLLGLSATWLTTRRLIGSLEYLGGRIRAIAGGDLTPLTRLTGRDELAALERNVNRLAEDLQKRELLKQYISSTTWDEIERSVMGGSTATASESDGGRLRKVTILFMDIRNFTALAESSRSRDVVELLNEIFGMMVDIIETYGGVLDKFIGDALLTVFYPDDEDDDAIRAVYCAVEMQLRLEQFNQRRAFYGRDAVRAGIGVNTGEVIAGTIGARTRKDYTVIGDPVNVAARLEKLSKEGHHTHIVISEDTLRGIEGLVAVAPVEGAEIRGRQRTMSVYEIVSVKDVDQILGLLTSTDPASREHAFRAVEARGDDEAVPVLVDLLEQGDEEVVLRAIVVLGRLGRTDERIGAVLRRIIETTKNKRILATAIKAAAVQAGRLDPRLLKELLSDEDSRVRANTIEALDQLGGSEYLEWIRPLIYDPSGRVRANAAVALWKRGRSEVASILERLSYSENVVERGSAVFAAGELFNVAARELPPAEAGRRAAMAVSEVLSEELAGYRKLQGIVRRALEDEDRGVRLQAVRAAARSRDSSVTEGLVANLRSCAPEDRDAIFETMISVGLPAPMVRVVDAAMGRGGSEPHRREES